jgi:protein involved in polysaccharide export with SLBB domain
LTAKISFLTFLFTITFAFAFVPAQNIQDLINKAHQMGLTDEQIKQQAAAMGYSVGDYLKLQQSQQIQQQQQSANLNQLRVRSGIDTTIFMPEKVKSDSMYYVKAFKFRGDADTLKAFGYDIFNYSPTTFQPSVNIPVPNSYVIGPGDEIVISLWGETQLVYNLTVAQDGSIYIPDVGLVYVSGLTMKGVREKLLSVLSKSYSSLNVSAKGGAKTHLDVTTGRLRSVKVYVLGEVNTPGGYTIPALSTAFTALYYSGGPTINGSLRDVQVIRGGKVVSTIDIYDYLVRGDQSGDIGLQDGDVLFVPPVGERVAIGGEIFRPGVYELKKGEQLKDLLAYAGGPNFNTYFQDVYIDRIAPFDQRKNYQNSVLTVDLNFKTYEEFKNSNYPLQDGDFVIIKTLPLRIQNRVAITGDIKLPGSYELTQGMTIRDLVLKADSVFPDAFLGKALLVRTDPAGRQSMRNFNLEEALKGNPENNLTLENLDSVKVYPDSMFNPERYVEIFGQVRKPGKYKAYSGMTPSDLIALAGGLTDSATTQNLEIARLDTTNETVYAHKFTENLPKDYWNSDRSTEIALKNYDKVFVQMDPLKRYPKNVYIEGEVKYPGAYAILSNSEKLSDFIKRAGGFKPTAYPEGMYVNRINPIFSEFETDTSKLSDTTIARLSSGSVYNRAAIINRFSNRIPIAWGDIEDDSTSIYNISLEPGDSLVIPRNLNEIYVLGAVGIPSTVPYKEGASLDYYINQAGGYAENAFEGNEIVIQPNGKKWEKGSWPFGHNDEILSGATIIVPTKVETRSDVWPTIRDILTVVSSSAVLVLTIKNLNK